MDTSSTEAPSSEPAVHCLSFRARPAAGRTSCLSSPPLTDEWQQLQFSLCRDELVHKLEAVRSLHTALQADRRACKAVQQQLLVDRERVNAFYQALQIQYERFHCVRRSYDSQLSQVRGQLDRFIKLLTAHTSLFPDLIVSVPGIHLPNDSLAISQEITRLTDLLKTAESSADREKYRLMLSRMQSRLCRLRGLAVLSPSDESTDLESTRCEVAEVPTPDLEVLKTVEVIKTRVDEERIQTRRDREDLYDEWVRSFQEPNLVEVVRSHATTLYSLEDRLHAQQKDLDQQRVRLATKHARVEQMDQRLQLKLAYFQESISQFVHEATRLIQVI